MSSAPELQALARAELVSVARTAAYILRDTRLEPSRDATADLIDELVRRNSLDDTRISALTADLIDARGARDRATYSGQADTPGPIVIGMANGPNVIVQSQAEADAFYRAAEANTRVLGPKA